MLLIDYPFFCIRALIVVRLNVWRHRSGAFFGVQLRLYVFLFFWGMENMNNEKFMNEIQQYSADDLRLILNTQQDLYSSEELKLIEEQLENRIKQDKKDEEVFIQQHLPHEITCPKCDGVNTFENEKCCYCGHTFDKSKYYNINYYMQDDTDTAANEENDSKSYTFQYIISFLIPLVGFILGAILLSKDDEEEKSAGKTVIILGIISIVIGTIITTFFIK